jgi:hypothetical protein
VEDVEDTIGEDDALLLAPQLRSPPRGRVLCQYRHLVALVALGWL